MPPQWSDRVGKKKRGKRGPIRHQRSEDGKDEPRRLMMLTREEPNRKSKSPAQMPCPGLPMTVFIQYVSEKVNLDADKSWVVTIGGDGSWWVHTVWKVALGFTYHQGDRTWRRAGVSKMTVVEFIKTRVAPYLRKEIWIRSTQPGSRRTFVQPKYDSRVGSMLSAPAKALRGRKPVAAEAVQVCAAYSTSSSGIGSSSAASSSSASVSRSS